MRHKRGEALSTLPAKLNPEQLLTAAQGAQLSGNGLSRYYSEVKAGRLPQPAVKEGRFVRWRAGDLLDAMAAKRAASE